MPERPVLIALQQSFSQMRRLTGQLQYVQSRNRGKWAFRLWLRGFALLLDFLHCNEVLGLMEYAHA
jgi:hypothetical protein